MNTNPRPRRTSLPVKLGTELVATPSTRTGALSIPAGTSDTLLVGNGRVVWLRMGETRLWGRDIHTVALSESGVAAVGDGSEYVYFQDKWWPRAEALRLQAANRYRIKTCERCGSMFGCQRSTKCWCSKLPALDVEAEFEDCLCGDCLRELTAVPVLS